MGCNNILCAHEKRAFFLSDARHAKRVEIFLRYFKQPNKCMLRKLRKVITNSVWALKMMLFMTIIDVAITYSLNVD